MPKEKPSKKTEKLEPIILEKGEVNKFFKIVTPEKLEKLGILTPKPVQEKGEKGISFEKAAEIMGEDYLGLEAVEATFKFRPDDIPPIPFSAIELERAKELGQFLIYRIDQSSDGQPLTMAKLRELIQPDFDSSNSGKIFNTLGSNPSCWYANENFAVNETPHRGWALVSKEILTDSVSKNYLSQTERLVQYIQNEVFKDQDIPEAYAVAIEEFENRKATIETQMSTNLQEAAKLLSQLKINQMCRHIPVEVFYDFVMRFKNNSSRYLESKYTWTSSRSSDGALVFVGYAVAGGASVLRWKPDYATGGLGAAFSRSL